LRNSLARMVSLLRRSIPRLDQVGWCRAGA
jgi:hypothetical protein